MYYEIDPQDQPYQHSDYLRYTIRTHELRAAVKVSVEFLRDKDFDAIAFMGNSGALLAAPIALALNKPLILVRKPDTKSHSDHICEGFRAAKNYVIIDDFIMTGKTTDYIREHVEKWAPKAVLAGVLECSRLLDSQAPFYHTSWPYGRRY